MDELRAKMLLRPLVRTGRAFYAWVAALLAANGWFVYNFLVQLREGHIVTGLGSPQGAIWGIIVANIVNLIGISHVGIAISAVVRVMKLEQYKPLARIAELVTLVALTTAVVNIALDVGRPDRFIINVVYYGRWHSPFVWSMTVITTYFLASTVYLYLAMRRDLAICAQELPGRSWLYRFLAQGYSDTEEERKVHDRTLWWLAIIILPIMISVHSVYGYIFGLQAGRPGWYNPFQAPYFVLGAIVSGFSAIIIVAAVLRKVFCWEEHFPPRMFRGLGIVLGFVTLLYMYFMFSEYLTLQYAAPSAERAVSGELLIGRYARLFWPTFILGMFVPFWILFVQGANPSISSVALTLTAAVPINIAMWIWRFLIVVPSFYHPFLPYKVATYQPSAVEWNLMTGSYAFAALLYTALLKILPVLEFPLEHRLAVERVPAPTIEMRLPVRQSLILATAILGLGLIALGIATRDGLQPPLVRAALATPGVYALLRVYSPSLTWVLGIVLLATIPLQLCVFRRERSKG